MKNRDIQVGKVYAAKISGVVVPVRLAGESRHGGWDAINLRTGRMVRIKSGRKLRY